MLHILGAELADEAWSDILDIAAKSETVGVLGNDYEGYENETCGIRLVYADLGENVQIDIRPYYALFAGLIGCAGAVVFGITLVKIICDGIWFLTFNATLMPAILLALILLVIAVCVPVFALRVFRAAW